jgi:hypothetical protein
MMRGVFVMAALVATLALPAAAQALSQEQVNAQLRADPEIWASLTALATARELARRCDSLDERTVRGRMHVVGLYNRARGFGATRAQIMAFVEDPGERRHLRAEVMDWFASHGLRDGDPEPGFCALGRQQIAARTLAGSFLAAR